nr:AAA family ATPase [Pseudomonas sp. BIGb0427]
MNRPWPTLPCCCRTSSRSKNSHEDPRHPPEEPGLSGRPDRDRLQRRAAGQRRPVRHYRTYRRRQSTLLDALCLALFGAVPRLSNIGRETKVPEVDSDILTSDPRTLLRRGSGSGFAEVDFVGIDSRRYRARWETNRARDKANGKLQGSRQSLHDLDSEQLLSNQSKAEYKQLIESRLGLNFEQFTRAVMLAQSEFSAFLKADDKERSELLEKTHQHGDLQPVGAPRLQQEQRSRRGAQSPAGPGQRCAAHGRRGSRRTGPALHPSARRVQGRTGATAPARTATQLAQRAAATARASAGRQRATAQRPTPPRQPAR